MKINAAVKSNFSQETIRRLGLYLRNLKEIRERGIDIISSEQITQFLNVTPVQFRKDLSFFGEFGKRGVGYNVERLIQEIENILGVNKQWPIIIVGAGKLGSALLGFEGFSKFNIKISHAFEADRDKIGRTKKGVRIDDIKNMQETVKNNNIKIAIISTPPEVAQDIANELIAAGVKGILNFAPVALKIPEGVAVSNVDMACELESLIFFAKQKHIPPRQSRQETSINNWTANRIKTDQIEKYLSGAKPFLNEALIHKTLSAGRKADKAKVNDILQKSLAVAALSQEEVAALINVEDKTLWEEMRAAAGAVKKKVYDNRIVTFAPLYLSNLCVNNCLYCAFRQDNSQAQRKRLDLEEVKRETEVLAGEIGHKRLIVVYGEHPQTDIDYMTATIKTIYEVKTKTKHGTGRIRRVNVNAPPLSLEKLKTLHKCGIGTYQVFQETYHPPTYAKLHPQGTLKGDYLWRLYCMHRALEAGVDDVGIGALFGLYDWRFEVLALTAHARELEDKFGVGPHTISFPRREPAANTPFSPAEQYKVSDADFERLVTVLRLAVPYAGMIITARETAEIRKKVIGLGCTQTDASSRIGIGAYGAGSNIQQGERQQFFLGDTRSLDEVIADLAQSGYITSFCTAGYRCGRTGECIMKLLRNGQEGRFCKLNAVLTFREWLDDFATPSTQKAGERIIQKELDEIKKQMPSVYPKLIEFYTRIKAGERDLYF